MHINVSYWLVLWFLLSFFIAVLSNRAGLPYRMGQAIIHRVAKNVPPLICYNLDIHGSITIILGVHITERVSNQNVLYFPTTRNLCFCTIWGNRNPKNCVFSLQCCVHFTKNTWNTSKYHLVAAEPPLTVKTIDWMH